MNSKPKISIIRKKLSNLNNRKNKIIFHLLDGKAMIYGFPYKIFKKCGKPTCKCATGEKHGPYPALSVCLEGKQKLVMVRKEDHVFVFEQAKRFQDFQKAVTEIRKINDEVDELLKEYKEMTTKEYQ